MDAVIRFKFTGEEAGEWLTSIRGGKCAIEQGVHASPTVTLSAEADEHIKVVTGQFTRIQAYLKGKMKVTGDLTLAMNLMGMIAQIITSHPKT